MLVTRLLKCTLEYSKNHVKIVEYPDSTIQKGGRIATGGGGMAVSAASASFSLKGEDCHTVSLATEDPRLAQSQTLNPPLVAFVGVFDGHDGPLASTYCSNGLLQHILIETERSIHAEDNESKGVKDVLIAAYVIAFHNAQDQFSLNRDPPTFEDLKGRRAMKKNRNRSIMRRLGGKDKTPKRGGTTACTLSIYAGAAAKPFALVANCGDSRLLTDDASGTTNFRQVTQDHRPDEPSELQRLKDCQRAGRAYLARVGKRHTLRVFPGGLAVSRTIGDVGQCRAIIPTPDVFVLPLMNDDDDDNDRGCTQRFVMASDGLWTYVSNEAAGMLAARTCVDGLSTRSPKQAVSELMEHCLQHGGYHDDVTILVVDVTIPSLPELLL